MNIGLKFFSYIHRKKRFIFESNSRIGWEIIYNSPEYTVRNLIQSYGNNIKEEYLRALTDLYLDRSLCSYMRRVKYRIQHMIYHSFVCNKIL